MHPAEASLTFNELCLDLALFAGVAEYGEGDSNAPVLPTDPNNLARVRRAVNDGYRAFVYSSPDPRGRTHPWSFLTARFTLAFKADGSGANQIDASTCALPWWIGPDVTHAHVAEGSSTHPLLVTSIDRVVSMEPQTGLPRMIAFTPADKPSAQPAAFHAVVWPSPASDVVVSAVGRTLVRDMVRGDDRHVAGARHDQAILACARYEWARQHADDARAARAKQDRDEKVAAAVSADAGAANLGPMRIIGAAIAGGPATSNVYELPNGGSVTLNV